MPAPPALCWFKGVGGMLLDSMVRSEVMLIFCMLRSVLDEGQPARVRGQKRFACASCTRCERVVGVLQRAEDSASLSQG